MGLEKIAYFAVLGTACFSGLSCRIGCLPYDTLLTSQLGENAAKHQRGIAYACRAGHIDMAHVRNHAELSEKYFKISMKNLQKGNCEFLFLGSEPPRYNVKIKYPQNWDSIDANKKQAIIKEVCAELGPYFAYMPSIMHETLTWFNWNSTPFVSEFPSAFSWEDRFSDTLGCYIGALALRDNNHNFKEALNILLQQELERLGIQPKRINEEAVKSVGGKWYISGLFGGEMLMRNFDIGEGDNQVSPRIPLISACEGAKPWDCPIPQLQYSKKMGFDFQIEIKPFVKKKVFEKILGKGTINPEKDYPIIMEYIRKDATARGYGF